MLRYFLITCLSFLLFSKSLFLKPLLAWATKVRSRTLWFFKELSFHFIVKSIKNPPIQSKMSFKRIPANPKAEKSNKPASVVDGGGEMSVLDLPELVLECILERLPPLALWSMAGVCSSLRERCVSDHLWEKHMKQKWGKVLGPAAYREWQWHIASRNDSGNHKQGRLKGFVRILSLVRSRSWVLLRSKTNGVDGCGNKKRKSYCFLPVDSIMNWYLALETGKFWFPAQVYNRENGHVGFMLSCYDAELCYDSRTDTFQARYPPHGRRAIAIEHGVPWERLRTPPLDASPHDLHVSECLNELKPGDQIEIQWRRNKEFPYGWWYGVVGHLESCDGNENHCHCHQSDAVVLEFNQYTPGSRWRCTTVNRKDHREEGNEADGFYGGIRKLSSEQEMATWKRLWPTSILE